jgi:tRNA(Ile)-lysidine synthase TilS/MesJ
MIKFSKDILNLALNKLPVPNYIIPLVSSGVDSTAGSHFFIKSKKSPRVIDNLHILTGLLHFNHGQRNQNDLMEEKFIKFTMDQKLPAWKTCDIKHLIKDKTEDSMRKARLEYINNNFHNTIFVSFHHLDDCVESYLLNILRGKEGFLPIPFITELERGNILCHPFLFTKKKDFIEYAEKNDLVKYVEEDETNHTTKGSRRNFLRKEVLPLLYREKMGIDTVVKKKIQERLMLEIIKS